MAKNFLYVRSDSISANHIAWVFITRHQLEIKFNTVRKKKQHGGYGLGKAVG
jgi:hypothetical protein